MLGIRPVQDHAISTSNMLQSTKVYGQRMNPVWSIDENIEILTRVLVRKDMRSLLPQLGEGMVEELSDVLFNVVYPAYERPMEI